MAVMRTGENLEKQAHDVSGGRSENDNRSEHGVVLEIPDGMPLPSCI